MPEMYSEEIVLKLATLEFCSLHNLIRCPCGICMQKEHLYIPDLGVR